MNLGFSLIVLSLVGASIVSSEADASNDSRGLLRRKVDESSSSLTKQQQQQQQDASKFFLCSQGLTTTYCRFNHSTCEVEPDAGNALCRCVDGYGGLHCNENVNECNQTPYPCAGGIKEGSFCVNYDPPERYKCGCRQGYDAVLPTTSTAQQLIDPVPVEWRPIKCIATVQCMDVLCHVNATCTSSPTTEDGIICICNDDLQGDGITDCTLPTTKPKTISNSTKNNKKNYVCTSNENGTTKLVNSICVDNVCTCKNGFYRSNGRGQCVNTVECFAAELNDCHRDATCEDTVGSYQCKCNDGYQDWNLELLPPGRDCAQINECLDPRQNDCNTETQVCLDRPPPTKWFCVERTPAPTPFPTFSQQENDCRTAGFMSVGLCIACNFLKLPSGDCESTTTVIRSSTALVGTIPSQLGLLTNLQWLDFSVNGLTGPIPSQLGLLINLNYLFLNTNTLTGTIPSQLGRLINLRMLYLSYNKLTGFIPLEINGLLNYNTFSILFGNAGLKARR